MLDCGLNMQTVLNFMPMPLVPSARFNSLPNWLPRDNQQDWQIEGVSIINLYFRRLNTISELSGIHTKHYSI